LTSCGDTFQQGHRQVDDPVAVEVPGGDPDQPTAVRHGDERRAERLNKRDALRGSRRGTRRQSQECREN